MPTQRTKKVEVTLETNDIEFDVVDDAAIAAIARSAQRLLDDVMPHPTRNSVPNTQTQFLRKHLWPTYRSETPSKPKLVLVPLSRLGGAQGFSGSHVLVGYFIPNPQVNRADRTREYPSYPMIIKTAKKPDGAVEDKLLEEKRAADSVEPFIYYADHFAIPVRLDQADSVHGYSVLWSRFASNTLEAISSAANRLLLAENNLWKLLTDYEKLSLPLDLRESSLKTIQTVTRDVFNLLKSLHAMHEPPCQPLDLIETYQWYLRGIERPGWGTLWCEEWASSDQETFQDPHGNDLINPLWVLQKLRNCPVFKKLSVFCGGVHGDLHPRNIVLTPKEVPHLIDFGWSAASTHVAKDFVLMEANLRFVTLSPDVPSRHVMQMSAWIKETDGPTTGHHYADNVIDLISQLRRIAKERFPKSTNWDQEYIVPLFLVSLGLLRHLGSCANQQAARITVLELASYIHKVVLPACTESAAQTASTDTGVLP